MQRTAAAILVVLGLLLAGCNSNDGNEKVAAGNDGSATTTSTATASTTVPPTTAAPAPLPTTTTTARPAPTTTTTSLAPPPGKARVTFVNRYPKTVDFELNGYKTTVKANGQTAPVDITPAADGNDVVNVHVHDDPSCGAGDADNYLEPGASYQFVVATGEGSGCGTQGEPVLRYEINRG